MRVAMLATFLSTCMPGVVSAFDGDPAPSSEARAEAMLRPVVDGVRWLPGDHVAGRQPDGNSIVFDAPEGWIIVDTGRHAEHVARLLASAEHAGRPVAAIVNTHWHLDHVSGNAAIRDRWPAADVHASVAIDGARTGFLADYRTQLVEAIVATRDAAQAQRWREEIARIDLGERLSPTLPVVHAGTRRIAGRTFELGLAAGATRGDVWLYDPASRVLVAGDLITLPAPFLDTACPARWRAAFAALAAVDFDVLIPGHGAPMDREGFNTYRRAFNNLLVCAATPTRTQVCVDGWRRDATALLPGIGAAKVDADRVDGMIAYYVDQRLRGPAATRDCDAP